MENEITAKNKINLGEVFDLNFNHYTEAGINAMGKGNFIEICNYICKKLLKLASENAKTTEISIEDWEGIDYESDFNYIPLMNEWEEIEGLNKIIINKQSILDTIKQVD